MKVQTLLEHACYTFGCNILGEILREKGWDCPESVELNVWAGVFRKNEEKFDTEKIFELKKPFPELLHSIAQIRHTAVHRVQVSANTVYQFITDAEALANILHNNTCERALSRLRREAKQVIDELGRNKDLLESMLKEKLQEIDARRRELDNLECKAVEDMLREDMEYQALASASLGQEIYVPAIIQTSESPSENGSDSEQEGEDESCGVVFGKEGESS